MGISIEVVQTVLRTLIEVLCIGIMTGLYWLVKLIQFVEENNEEEE